MDLHWFRSAAARRRALIVALAGLAIAVWWGWWHLVRQYAYRPPYDLWACQLDNGGPIGDPTTVVAKLAAIALLLVASVLLVRTVAAAIRRRHRLWGVAVAAPVVLVPLISWLAVAIVDGPLYQYLPGITDCG